jgi:uncharacterized protein
MHSMLALKFKFFVQNGLRFSGLLVRRAVWQLALLCSIGAAPVLAQTRPTDCPPTAQPPSVDLFREATVQAKDRGLLWRIRKDGHDSYLYGTLHVGRALWMVPGPKLAAALRESDTLALELDPLDPQVQATMRTSLAQRPSVTLPVALRQRLDQQLARECLTAIAADLGPVEMQVMGLATLVGRRAGYDPGFGSEVLLSAMAQANGMPVQSLETVDQQLDALLSSDAAQAVETVAEGLDDLESGRQARVLMATVQAWDRSDIKALENYAAWCECTETPLALAQMHRLLDERNPLMARGIARLHQQGKRVLAAVGSLHMVGPQGLPALLAKQGYAVQRLQ